MQKTIAFDGFFKGQITSIYEQNLCCFKSILFYWSEKICSLRESHHNDLYIDNQKKQFELLVQNPKNLNLK